LNIRHHFLEQVEHVAPPHHAEWFFAVIANHREGNTASLAVLDSLLQRRTDVGLLAALVFQPKPRKDYIWIVVAMTGLPPAANVFSVSRERFA
jgi:hypothetical protein